MASFDTTYYGLLRTPTTLGIETTTASFPAYITVISTAESLSSTYYYLSLERDSRFNSADYPTEFFDDIETALGITLVEGDTFVARPLDEGLTKQQRQVMKLEISAKKRTRDGNPRDIYDITQLPDTYNDNVPGADDNANTGGLVLGRPWVELSAGLYRRTYSGYFNDVVTWFATATQTAAVADSTLAVGSTPTTTSIQWLGYFVPGTTETYTFFINSDDASYLWIGANAIAGFTTGNALINNGGPHAATELSATIALTAGVRYAIRIQTGNGGGQGSHATSFSTPTIAKTQTFTNRVFYNPVTNGY
jgi:hypothetical protein